MPMSNSFAPSLQRNCRPLAHHLQRPQLGMNDMDTWSPTATLVTPSPTASTTPEPSWPPITGSGRGRSPVVACSSEWHMPANAILTSTSPAFGSSSWTSSIFQSSPTPHSTAARVVVAIVTPCGRAPEPDRAVAARFYTMQMMTVGQLPVPMRVPARRVAGARWCRCPAVPCGRRPRPHAATRTWSVAMATEVLTRARHHRRRSTRHHRPLDRGSPRRRGRTVRGAGRGGAAGRGGLDRRHVRCLLTTVGRAR